MYCLSNSRRKDNKHLVFSQWSTFLHSFELLLQLLNFHQNMANCCIKHHFMGKLFLKKFKSWVLGTHVFSICIYIISWNNSCGNSMCLYQGNRSKLRNDDNTTIHNLRLLTIFKNLSFLWSLYIRFIKETFWNTKKVSLFNWVPPFIDKFPGKILSM